jgi:hypothetical protein
MLYYDAAGKRVKDPDAAVRQYLSDDPARPDASAEEREGVGPFTLTPSGPKGVPLYFYDADGKRVSAPVSGGRQFAADDPNRPDAADQPAPKAAPNDQPTAIADMTKAQLVAVAGELDIAGASSMKKDDLLAAVQKAQADADAAEKAKSAAPETQAQSEPPENKAVNSSANK